MSMIRVGIGGWNFPPWRGVFYPKGLAQARELAYAAENVTSIEINSTFYRTQTPQSFRRWAAETPDDFVFSVKAVMFATNKRVLGEAGPAIARFCESGIGELGRKLGPILWQFRPTKKFEPEDFGAFLSLLPRDGDGLALRHAVEVRHPSFVCKEFVALARKHGVAIVLADSEKYPLIADPTADFVYARLQNAAEEIETGYTPKAIAQWGARAKAWESGGTAGDLPLLAATKGKAKTRDVFLYMINGAKVRAPAAAMALLKQLGKG